MEDSKFKNQAYSARPLMPLVLSNVCFIIFYCLTKISIRSSVNFPADFVCLWNPVQF